MAEKKNVVYIYWFLKLPSGDDRYHSSSYCIGQSKLPGYALLQAEREIIILPCFTKEKKWNICDSFNDFHSNCVHILFSVL